MKEDWPDHATREEVQRLREQIQHLRAPQHKEVSHATLMDSMERLQESLDRLTELFEQANKEVYAEYEKGLHDQAERLKRLEEQNEKIARGIVAVADMLKQRTQAPQTQPAPRTAPVPQAQQVQPIRSQAPPAPAAAAFPPHDEPFTTAPVTPLPDPALQPRSAFPPASEMRLPPPLVPSAPSAAMPPVPLPPPPPFSAPAPEKNGRRSVIDKFSFR